MLKVLVFPTSFGKIAFTKTENERRCDARFLEWVYPRALFIKISYKWQVF